MSERPSEIDALIAAELSQPVSDGVTAAADEVRRRHGDAVAAILFYGSCLRDGDDGDDGRVIDFYLFVERYRELHDGIGWAMANAILPPNVYYLSVPHGARTVRAKCAVVSMAALARGTSRRAFQSALWGRFCQPCALVYARDGDIEGRVKAALAEAVETMSGEVVALLPATFSARELWARALRESYRTEIRAERVSRSEDLYAAFADRYDRLTVALLAGGRLPGCTARPGSPTRIDHDPSGRSRRRAGAKWWLRRIVGKAMHVLRLVKAAFTFRDGLDYALWKIECHSGVRATATPWQRRHPLLAAPALAWRLYRRGAFR